MTVINKITYFNNVLQRQYYTFIHGSFEIIFYATMYIGYMALYVAVKNLLPKKHLHWNLRK